MILAKPSLPPHPRSVQEAVTLVEAAVEAAAEVDGGQGGSPTPQLHRCTTEQPAPDSYPLPIILCSNRSVVE